MRGDARKRLADDEGGWPDSADIWRRCNDAEAALARNMAESWTAHDDSREFGKAVLMALGGAS